VRPVAAQDPPFERIQLSKIVVKPGMTSAWEAQVKVLNEARAKAKDPAARSLWQVGRGGPPRTYYSVIRFNKWAELGSLTMNSMSWRRRSARGRAPAWATPCRTPPSPSRRRWAYAWPTESNVRPASIPRWDQQVAARVAAAKKSPSSPPAVRYRTTLGPSARYITARYFDKWGDVDGWPC
jgi:hypothetical protein